MVRGLEDEALERRFAEPRRQRALLRAMARGFQPAHAGGFRGVIAYELEPFAIEAPPDAPWRWAIEVDSAAGRARLLEPAPLDAAVTIHFGLAEWVRVIAGVQNALTRMVAGRCSVEGDVHPRRTPGGDVRGSVRLAANRPWADTAKHSAFNRQDGEAEQEEGDRLAESQSRPSRERRSRRK